MSMRSRTHLSTKNLQTKVPVQTRLDPVWVQCKGYRCLAFIDVTGKWINFYTGKKLTGLIKVIG
jgi:hypothetical protein